MKTGIISNLRPFLRAFYPFLIAIAVLVAVPRNAHAQHLYVTQVVGIVSEYDATTGGVINANFITGLFVGPAGLALTGNTLFVANQGPNTVGRYNATTGAAINASFITGLSAPLGLAVSSLRLGLLGEEREKTLFVANLNSGTIGEYDAKTGAAINTNFITGLSGPLGLAVNGSSLFVVNNINGTVGKYNATTGAVIKADFILGLRFPQGIAVKSAA